MATRRTMRVYMLLRRKGIMYFDMVYSDFLAYILIFNLAGVFKDILVGYNSFPYSWKPYLIDSKVTPIV